MDNSNLMKYKFVVCGDTVEVYEYSTPISVGHSRDYDIVRRDSTEEKCVKRNGNLYRSRQNVRRIIWSNQGKYTKFVTLTYADIVLDVKRVRRDVTTFVQNMRRLGYDMKYLYVLEQQKKRGEKEGNSGCLHIHMLIFIDKFIPYQDINKCWKKGSTDIQAVEDINNLGAYVSKYITKDNFAEFGKKCYACSLNLNRGETERFYLGQYSDTLFNVQGNDILQGLDINFYSSMRHDYISPTDGSAQVQTVKYYQGKWKDKNLIKELDPLYDFKRQIDDLHLSENE